MRWPKTSSCHILAHILRSKGKKVLLLTSSGLVSMGKEVEVLEEKVSIAPASILRLSRMKGDWDYGVFECSLGGTGLADIGMVTNAREEYAIAAGTRSSTDGKVQMVRSAKQNLVIASEDEGILEGDVPSGGGPDDLRPGRGRPGDGPERPGAWEGGAGGAADQGPQHSLDALREVSCSGYSTGLNAAAALAFAAGVNPIDIARSLSSFRGVPGRGEVEIRKVMRSFGKGTPVLLPDRSTGTFGYWKRTTASMILL